MRAMLLAAVAAQAGIRTETHRYPLEDASFQGAAVLVEAVWGKLRWKTAARVFHPTGRARVRRVDYAATRLIHQGQRRCPGKAQPQGLPILPPWRGRLSAGALGISARALPRAVAAALMSPRSRACSPRFSQASARRRW